MVKPSILDEARAHGQKTGARLTEPRLAVLGVIDNAGKPLGAYDILEKMPKGTQPPTVYRALEFWEKEGFLHRIGSLNLYAICKAGHRHDGAQFLICTACNSITENHICEMPADFAAEAQKRGFNVESWFLELRGLCKNCSARPDQTRDAQCQC